MNSSVDIILKLIQLTLLIVPDLLGCGCAHQILDSELLISKNDMNAFHFVIIELQCIVCVFFGLLLMDPEFQTRSGLQPVSGVLLTISVLVFHFLYVQCLD